eukprot:12948587-Heterocapsa_arctica.AAC.1
MLKPGFGTKAAPGAWGLELKIGDCVHFFKDPPNKGHERVAWTYHRCATLSYIGRGGWSPMAWTTPR